MEKENKRNEAEENRNDKNQEKKASQKTVVTPMDIPAATENVRTRHAHGHGLRNEGTNVDYEERRR